ncbi:PLP-dependent aminotransferase family protein [Streptomyces sp. NPDC053474]|uniref:MocR-like transcription factor YczR n=1 Tax=Streptomyces sp. NPDC053474 TaxID=3365704 RepID=UPI0037D3D026
MQRPQVSRAATRIGAQQLCELLGEWRADGGSAYRALAASVRELVRDGRLSRTSRLPAERDLADVLAVSRTTVASAYELLRAEGGLISLRGVGSFVVADRVEPRGAKDPGPIDLSIAALPAPEPWLSRTMARAVAELPGYTGGHGAFPAGLPELRVAIAARYTARGLPTDAEQILVTNGATGAFTLLVRQFGAPGDRMVVETPTHPGVLRSLTRAGIRPVPVRLLEYGWNLGAWREALHAAQPRLACVTPDFHAPTGLVMQDEQRRDLVALARAAGVTLVTDETMAELSLEPAIPPPPPLAAHDPADEFGAVITVGSASKAYWGGLRIGWIRAGAQTVRLLAEQRLGLDVSSPVIDQLVLARLLGDPDVLAEVLDFQRDRARARRDALVALLRRELPAWTFQVPTGGLALWARTEGASARAVADAAERHGVRLGAGPHFGVAGGSPDDHVRLPYTQPPDVLAESVRRLAEALRSAECATALAGRDLPMSF